MTTRMAALAATLVLAAPTGPPSSSLATSGRGVAAYASLLEEFGFEVESLRTPVDETALDGDWTLVVLDPPALDVTEVAALRAFVADGGRLIAGGEHPDWVDDLVDRPPTWRSGGITSFSASGGDAVAGVTTVETAGDGTWSDPGGGTVLAGTSTDALAVEVAGTVTLLADVSPLQNRLLATADNAGFALSLAAGAPRPVVFVESVHGFEPPRGLSAIPARWRWAGAGFAFATALWMWARGRRLGPPEEPRRVLPPPRLAYVEALAATLARARRPEGGNR